MIDEAAQLRADLAAGRWQRLVDPLLPLVLLEDAGSWWHRAYGRCLGALSDDLLNIPYAGGITYSLPQVERRLERRGVPCPAHRAALDVLRRWPAG